MALLNRGLFFSLLILCALGILLGWRSDLLFWSPFESLIYLLLVVWTVLWATGRARGSWTWLLFPLLGILALGALQLAMHWSAYQFVTGLELIRWGTFSAVFFLGFQLADSGRASFFRKSLAVFSLVLAVVGVLQYFLGNGKIFWLFELPEAGELRRFLASTSYQAIHAELRRRNFIHGFGVGPFLNRDHYASFVALVLPCAVVQAAQDPRKRWFFGLTMAVLYGTVIAAASRAGFVLVTLELLILFVLLRPSRQALAGAALLLIAFALVFGLPLGEARTETLYDRLLISDPYAGRREVAIATWRMFEAAPYRGFGLGTWPTVYPAFAVTDFGLYGNAAHNDWLQWAGEGGIPMVAFLAVFFAGSIAVARKAPWALGVPIVFLHSWIDFPMQGRFLPSLVFLLCGIAAGSVAHHRSRGNRHARRPLVSS